MESNAQRGTVPPPPEDMPWIVKRPEQCQFFKVQLPGEHQCKGDRRTNRPLCNGCCHYREMDLDAVATAKIANPETTHNT